MVHASKMVRCVGIFIFGFSVLISCSDLLADLDTGKHPLHIQLHIISPAADTATVNQPNIPVINEISFHITGNSLYTPNGKVYSLPYSEEPILLKQADMPGFITQTHAPANNYKDFDLMLGAADSDNNSAGALQISGTLNGNPFTYEIEDPFFIDFEMSPPFSHGMGKDSLSVLVITFDHSNWLSEEDITGNMQASDTEIINRIIESASLEIFESGTKTGNGNPKNNIRVSLANDPEISENSGNAQFIVELSEVSPDTIWVDFQTKDNSAKAGEDYADSTGTLILEPGLTKGLINIAVFDDDQLEPDQKFSLILTDARGAAINNSKAQAMATIINDDEESATGNEIKVGLINNPQLYESDGSAHFIVALFATSSDTVWVDFQTKDNSAKAGEDFADSTGTLILEPGLTEGLINIAVFDDDKWEPDQKFSLLLTNARGAVIDKSKELAMATIINDDKKNKGSN